MNGVPPIAAPTVIIHSKPLTTPRAQTRLNRGSIVWFGLFHFLTKLTAAFGFALYPLPKSTNMISLRNRVTRGNLVIKMCAKRYMT